MHQYREKGKQRGREWSGKGREGKGARRGGRKGRGRFTAVSNTTLTVYSSSHLVKNIEKGNYTLSETI